MFELVIRTLYDTCPRTVDGVYLFAQTPDNQASVLFKARQLLQQGVTKKIMFAETGERSGYLGFAAWKQHLLGWDIAESVIEGVPVSYDIILHTLTESLALAKWAKQMNYQTLVVVAPPFHQPRAFMTAVTAILREYPALRIYSLPGETLPWLGEAVHSQGNEKAIRKDLIQGEQERIKKYHAGGDLASFDQVLQYLNKRDQQANSL